MPVPINATDAPTSAGTSQLVLLSLLLITNLSLSTSGITVKLTRRREFVQASPDQSLSFKAHPVYIAPSFTMLKLWAVFQLENRVNLPVVMPFQRGMEEVKRIEHLQASDADFQSLVTSSLNQRAQIPAQQIGMIKSHARRKLCCLRVWLIAK